MMTKEVTRRLRFDYVFMAVCVIALEHLLESGVTALLAFGVIELIHIRVLLEIINTDSKRSTMQLSRRRGVT